MKKLFAAALASAAVIATPAAAQSVSKGSTLTYNVDAEVGVICGVYHSGGTSVAIDFDDLANVPSRTFVTREGGNAVYRCNSAAGFSREIRSANGGMLLRVGSTQADNIVHNSIGYTFQHEGTGGLAVPQQSLRTPVTANFAGSSTFLRGTSGAVRFAVTGVSDPGNSSVANAPGTSVYAGDYTDTVTITVNAR